MADQAHQFAPKILTRESLARAVDNVVATNPGLSEEAKKLVAQLYTKFRARIVPALTNANPAVGTVFWIGVISDMMNTLTAIKLSGTEKKMVLIEVLHIVATHEIPPEGRESAITVIDLLIAPAIDLAIQFASDTKKIKSWFKKNCGCC